MGETEGTMKQKVYVTRRWWETEREKYHLVVSEAVEAECERGDPETVKRPQELLEEVSLFPVDQRILDVSQAARRSGRNPHEGWPRCSAYCGGGC